MVVAGSISSEGMAVRATGMGVAMAAIGMGVAGTGAIGMEVAGMGAHGTEDHIGTMAALLVVELPWLPSLGLK